MKECGEIIITKFGLTITKLTVYLLLTFNILPANSAFRDEARTEINWSSSNLYLSKTSYIEQEILFLKNDSISKPGHRFHLEACWKPESSSMKSTSNNLCGFVGIGINSISEDSIRVGLDFHFWHGLDFEISGDSEKCEKRGDGLGELTMGKVQNIDTYYIVCWTSATLFFNTPYLIRFKPDFNSASTNEFWWRAELINPKTGELLQVGRIKNFAININESLMSVRNVYFYGGGVEKCNEIPILDLKLKAVQSSTKVAAKYRNFLKNECILADFGAARDQADTYYLKFGGSDPKSRSGLSTGISTNTSQSSPSTTQIKPSLSFINISGNTLNLSVNVGSGGSKPDQIYLMAPQLSSLNGGKILGKMNGSKATWAIKLDKALSGKTIPLKIVGVKNGVESEAIQTNYLIPKNFVIMNKPPVFPTPNTQTVICTRGQQSRAFVGKVCPPGWKG